MSKTVINNGNLKVKRKYLLKRFRLCLTGVFFLFFIFLINTDLLSDDYGTLWGVTIDSDNQPLPGVQIIISHKEQGVITTRISNPNGSFVIPGLSPGCYSASFEAQGYHPLAQDEVFLEPSQSLYLKIILTTDEKSQMSTSQLLRIDYTNCLQQTVLDESQIHNSPSAHNVWFLVENYDLSATTNRIDVGGLWGTIPALFSSRGSISWTQNVYLLNGLDVTDPYWTGKPLFYPDFYSLSYTQLINAGHPSQALSPGGFFNLFTFDGSDRFQGSVQTFFIEKKLQSSNISPALEEEGIYDSHSFNNMVDGNIRLSGPVIPEKLSFFTSLSSSHISRDLAEFDQDDNSSVYSGLFSLKYRYSGSTLRFLWTGQKISHPSFGAGRNIPFITTSDLREIYNVFQLIWSSRILKNHHLKAGISIAHGNSQADFQEESKFPHELEILKDIPSKNGPLAYLDKRSSITFLLKAESYFVDFFKTSHKLQYGFQLQRGFSSSQKEIQDNLHLHFFQGNPLEMIRYNTPLQHEESATHLNFFFQDTILLSSFLSFYLGANLAYSKGLIPDQLPESSLTDETDFNRDENSEIDWLNVSPRLGLIIPLGKSKASALKISLARYYHTLPLYYLTYGNPNALGGLAYVWQDKNDDRQFQEGEQGNILRREGAYFSSIDPDLKRPYTDELSIAYTYTFSSKWYFSIAGFYRETRNLIETTNIGVPFSDYDEVKIFDKGDDRVIDTPDDFTFTVYNQKQETLGNDFFFLTNADSDKRVSRYYGLDLYLVKKFSEKFTFFLSLTATEAPGTTSPGNTEWENDDGVVGSLYDNPNSLINARGRMRFDRAYTGRLGFNYLAPFGIRLACTIKYYDGQPFTRKIIVQGLNQGPFYFQAFPRGVARYEYNRTVEARLEKIFTIQNTKLRLIIDVFNLINRGLATEENEWTSPEFPLRYATEIQSPRVFRLGLAYEF